MTVERDARRGGSDRRARLAAILLVLALTVALQLSGMFEPFEHGLTSIRARLLDKPPTGKIAIVEIDAKSLKEISTWPWSRRYHALALERLHAAGAEMVAFDIDFSALSEPVGDRAFASALKRYEPTILPIFQQRASDDPAQATMVRSRPAPMFGDAWVGGVNIFAGSDGVVRDYPAATMIGGRIQPSMAALLADNDDFGDRTFEPDWAVDAGRIPRLSFADVVAGRVPPQAIAGKRLIIGATALELGDRYVVPRFGTVPGVVVQALAADSLFQNRALSRSGTLATILGAMLVALLLGAIRFRRFSQTFPPAALAVLAVLAVGPIAIEARWPVSVDSAAMLFCAAACILVRILLEVQRCVRLRALVDAQTGLGNLRALELKLTSLEAPQVIVAAARIERFDDIRDALGGGAIARMISEASARIEAAVGHSVYRIAPDTLAWIDEDDGAADRAIAKLETLFRDPVHTPQGPVDLQLTIGMDRDPAACSAQSKIERAFAAIGSARSAGQSFHWYQGADPGMRRELSLMGELRRGIENGEVTVAYQPKLDLASGRVSNAEALVRWLHPGEGFIPPDRFVPLAESTGVVRELTAFVLRRAAADLAALQKAGRAIGLAVNISAADIAGESFVDEVMAALGNSMADPRGLTLEVTESAMISSPETAIRVLAALRESGVQVAVDDYGTGQSTLSYLKHLPLDELKIDKSFITSIGQRKNDEIMVRSTIDLAHELELRVVAEGVEDASTLALLKSLGCDYAQGYLIGKAMPFEQLCNLADSAADLRSVA